MAGTIANTVDFLKLIFSEVFTRLIIAIVVVLLGFILGRIVGRLIQKALHEVELNNLIKKATGINFSVEQILTTFITYLIYFIFIVIALERLNIGAIAFNILAGGVIAIIILSVFLGIKDFIPNMISGIFIHQKKFIDEGDDIRFDDVEGKVVNINLVETRIVTKSGDLIYIPNSLLVKSKFIKLKGNKNKITSKHL